MAVDDEAGDVVGLVGNQGLVQEARQRGVGQHVARGHPLLGRGRPDPGQVVAGARRTGTGHDLAQIVELVDLALDRRAIAHRSVSRGRCRLSAGR